MDNEIIEQKKKIRELRQKVLFAWHIGIKNSKLYTGNHPSFQTSAQLLVAALNEVFKVTLELSVQHTEGLFRIDEDIFLEESLTMTDMLMKLEEGKISRVLFLPGITEEEAAKFIAYISSLKSVPGQSLPIFSSDHLRVFPETAINKVLSEKDRTFERIKETLESIKGWSSRTEAIFARLIDEQTLSVAELADPLDELIDALHRNPSLFSIGLSLPKKGNLHLEHAVHSMIYSTYLGQQIGYDTTVLKSLAISALCHDMGRQFLPTDFTTGYLMGKSDLDLIKLHCKDGASFLSGVQGLPLTVVRVALEHHIGFDGIGYPALPAGLKAHPFSQIVAIADFLSWQTISENIYHKPVSLSKLVRCLLRRSGTQFNPLMVKLMLPFLGFYPPGSQVLLNTGEKAVCLEPNTRNIARPAVGVAEHGYKWLSQVSNGTPPFSHSVAKLIANDPDIEHLLPLIPNILQTTT